ncbi:MAG TPA: DNA gyrase subunit A, partial [Geminicoccaceae bacterium]
SIPPHNAGELCDALIRLLERPETSLDELFEMFNGPDLPTGGVLIEPRATLIEAYRHGRGSMRLRARWTVERLSHGQYEVVVTEMPYQVPKARLVERIAELLQARKLAHLADVRDESAEEVRLVLVPRSRGVAPEALMEQMFRQTELEVRLPLNLNVLDKDGVPRVMGLKEALLAFLDHRMTVLIRRSRHRLAKIDDRLEVLSAFLIVYLNLDEVIRIIREEDEPKAALVRAFELTERQATAILDMRLRNLRRLEEEGIRKEQRGLKGERKELERLLADEGRRRDRLIAEIRETRERFGTGPLGARRTSLEEAPLVDAEALEAPVERLPVTVLCSRQGWIRVLRGHLEDPGELKYKEGDGPAWVIQAQSTDKLLMLSSDGRSYVLGVDRLPGGRGHGEPLRLQVDLARSAEPVHLDVLRTDGRLLLATDGGRGFVVEEAAAVTSVRAGRQVVNLDAGERLLLARRAEGDLVACLGSNRKLLVFELAELPVMTRGKGVLLQRVKGGRLADVKVFAREAGLVWAGTKARTLQDIGPFLGKRGQAGRVLPNGFPRRSRFDE